MAHLLRYGTAVQTSIVRNNPHHNFAHLHAMHVYDSNAVYSMIPKNGCTTMRLSLARANGIMADNSQWQWIHFNNDSFRPSLRELALADYRFTVLRDPFGRLVSCYLDKIVKRTPDASKYLEAVKDVADIETLTFRQFCHGLTKQGVLTSNIHWRPQVHFLVYQDYDDYFCFEDFQRIAPRLKNRIGLEVIDARPIARHDTSHYRQAPTSQCFADAPLPQLELLRRSGLTPKPESFYDEELINLVSSLYDADFDLYRSRFPGFGMFRDYQPRGVPAAV